MKRKGRKTYSGVKGLAEQDAMIQYSQGPIADRTRRDPDHDGCCSGSLSQPWSSMERRRLAAGNEPVAPQLHAAYRTRPGSWIAGEGRSFEDVMLERFADPLGRVAAE